jgi:hypothetical protein
MTAYRHIFGDLRATETNTVVVKLTYCYICDGIEQRGIASTHFSDNSEALRIGRAMLHHPLVTL